MFTARIGAIGLNRRTGEFQIGCVAIAEVADA
jgi:hypothetical protein